MGRPGRHPGTASPGAATSRSLGFGFAELDRLGVRLISVDRPGLGASGPDPGRGFDSFAEDLRRLTEHLGLGRPPLVGNAQGAPFALAAASAGVVSGLAVVSGADEVAAPELADALPVELRGLVDTVAADRAAAEAVFAGFDAGRMWRLVMSVSPASDLAVYRSPAFAAAYRKAMGEAFAQGSAGYAVDTVLAMGRWSIDLAAIRVPVWLWYGAEDTSHSPDNGAWLASRIPGARRELVDGIGGALLWTHAGPILRKLL